MERWLMTNGRFTVYGFKPYGALLVNWLRNNMAPRCYWVRFVTSPNATCSQFKLLSKIKMRRDAHLTHFNRPRSCKRMQWWLITQHSTITWLTLARSLDCSGEKIKTITSYSDPNHNEKIDLLPCKAMSRYQGSFLPMNLSGKHFNPTSCGVIRNQRSKIRRSYTSTTAGALLKNLKNRVI